MTKSIALVLYWSEGFLKPQYLHRCSQRKHPRRNRSFQRRSVPKCRTDLLQAKSLHRFAKMKPKFTDVPLLSWIKRAQKYREIKGFRSHVIYQIILGNCKISTDNSIERSPSLSSLTTSPSFLKLLYHTFG